MRGGRQYQRKFDWEEARKRHQAGESIAKIAADLGVSHTAVHRVVNPKVHDQMREYGRNWQKSGVCGQCGGANTRRYPICLACANKNRANVKDGTAYCPKCASWKPLDQFTPTPSRPGRQVHGECRACGTQRRAAWRDKNRERQREYDREYRRRRRAQQV
jgi:hypothetical protein